jgi:maltose alpha-D-glucosyltransferase/alpha-amylase
MAAIERGTEVPTERGTLRFKHTSLFAQLAGGPAADLPVGKPQAQSSNTIVVFGEQLFLKGYRRIRAGINPEFEIGHYLTEVAHFAHCVPVAGALEFVGKDGTAMTLAMVQGYVANQGDGWAYSTAYLQRHLEGRRTTHEPELPDAHGGYLALIETLGRRTAEMHLAFAMKSGDPAFEPEPITPDDLAGYRRKVAEDARLALSALEARLPQLPADAQDEARAVLRSSATIGERIELSVADVQRALKTRYHGDYHLGQVLVTKNDFVIIDFEGEPARSFEERRTKSSPLRDVASMLRSFNYARWSALRRVAQSTDEAERLAAPAIAWERATRDAFLAGYGEALDAELLSLFELDKALYELRYELGNRIDWAQVPLHGVLALIQPPRA